VLALLTKVEAFYGAVIAHYAGVYHAFSPFFGQTFQNFAVIFAHLLSFQLKYFKVIISDESLIFTNVAISSFPLVL
jgi:hypothetical protein